MPSETEQLAQCEKDYSRVSLELDESRLKLADVEAIRNALMSGELLPPYVMELMTAARALVEAIDAGSDLRELQALEALRRALALSPKEP